MTIKITMTTTMAAIFICTDESRCKLQCTVSAIRCPAPIIKSFSHSLTAPGLLQEGGSGGAPPFPSYRSWLLTGVVGGGTAAGASMGPSYCCGGLFRLSTLIVASMWRGLFRGGAVPVSTGPGAVIPWPGAVVMACDCLFCFTRDMQCTSASSPWREHMSTRKHMQIPARSSREWLRKEAPPLHVCTTD